MICLSSAPIFLVGVTICIVIAGIFHLNHTYISARFQDRQIRISLLPEPCLLIVEDYINRVAYKPPVGFIPCLSRSKSYQLVTVGIQVNAGSHLQPLGLSNITPLSEISTPLFWVSPIFAM